MKGYYKYIEDVQSGKVIACLQIRQAVTRFLDMQAREDIYFDEECVDLAIQFIAQMKHFLGKSNGRNFKLEGWQQFLVANLLGLKWLESGYRVCRESYIQVSRKAGKDAFMAALALYMMIVDGEASPQIACLANSREQARILFEYVTNFGKSLDPKGTSIKAYRNYVKFPSNNGEVKVFSADASKLDGLNISLAVIDEFHEAKDRKMYDVMKSSMGMRTQPLMVVITTAGFNLESPCRDMYTLSIEILSGVKKDDTFFPFIFQLDVDDDIEDENNWYKCQPNLDVTVTKEFMRAEVLKMKNDSTAEVGIRTKTFNQWCTSEMVWVKPEYVVKCMDEVDLEKYIGYTCVAGVDLGAVNDLTALSIMIPLPDKKIFKNWSFLPEETYKNHPNKALYDKFIQEGSLIITPGNVCDYDYIANKIREINEVIPVTAVYYDKWNSTQWAITMTEMGFNLVEFSQSIGNYNACTKEFQRLALTGGMTIDKSSNFLWQMTCVTLKTDFNGNCLALDTLVPTPNGFKQIKDIEIGDYVYNQDGVPTKVVDTTDVHYGRDCYKLTFKNGAEVIADNTHRWWVSVATCVRENGKKTTKRVMDYRDTEWLYKHYKNKQGHCQRYTIMNGAVQYPEKEYIIDPYVLGCWLGDGTSKSASFTVHTGDTSMYDYMKNIYGEPTIHNDKRSDTYHYLTFTGKTFYRQLVQTNLLNNKHIPNEYLYGSVEQRLALVQGLMDTDGSCNKINGECSFTQKKKWIIDRLAIILDSLGIRHSKVTEFKVNDVSYYRLIWHTNVPMFRLQRKLDIQKANPASQLNTHNPIMDIEKVESVPTKCITVEDDRHLFLITDKYLVTSNCKPSKESWSNKKIDNVISCTTALGGFLKQGGNTNDFEILVF